METKIELEGVNGEWFTLAGEGAGDRGVHLGTDVQGFYDPPVKVMWEEPANLPGARYLAHRILRRDVLFGVEILNDAEEGPDSWKARDSEWRKAWAYDETCKLYVTTEDGTRHLNLRMSESPEVSMHTDPNDQPVNRTIMTCAAGDPFWYDDDVTYTWVTPSSTENGSTLTYWMPVQDPNPTDQHIWPVWIITAPGKWTLPDYSWQNDALAQRRIIMPTLLPGEHSEISVDPRIRQVEADNGANVLARMKGVRFRHSIPPYTLGEHQLQIQVTNAPANSMVQLRLARPWSRPWGLW